MSELNTTSERKKWYTDKIYTCHLNCALCKRAKQKHASFFNLFCFLVCRQASRRGAPGVPLSRREVKERVRRAGTKQARRIHQQLEGRKKQAAWYAAATAYQSLAASQQQPRADGALLQRVRLGCRTSEELYDGFQGQECGHCGRLDRQPLLYLLSCPATAALKVAQSLSA